MRIWTIAAGLLLVGTIGSGLLARLGDEPAPARPSNASAGPPPRIDVASSDRWLAELERGNAIRFVVAEPPDDPSDREPANALPDDIVPLPTLDESERAELRARCRRLAAGCRQQLDDLLLHFDENDPDQQRRWGEYDRETELFTACERAVEAGTFFVEADGVWRRAPGATIFRMPWSRNGRTVFVQLVLRHSEHYGVANSERFLSHQRALAAGMVADRFNGMPYDQRLALVERRADLLRSAPDAPETQRFLAGHFPDDVVLQQPELILRPAL